MKFSSILASPDQRILCAKRLLWTSKSPINYVIGTVASSLIRGVLLQTLPCVPCRWQLSMNCETSCEVEKDVSPLLLGPPVLLHQGSNKHVQHPVHRPYCRQQPGGERNNKLRAGVQGTLYVNIRMSLVHVPHHQPS